tara:strand:- start:105 stop:515 length:411 start_codon:yes stop_codon:yes gene_type:complete
MFPSLDNDVIKMVIDENKEEDILDIFLQLSLDLEETESKTVDSDRDENFIFCDQMFRERTNSKIEKSGERDTDDILQYSDTCNDIYTESDCFLGEKKKNETHKQGFFSSLFKRNVKKDNNKDIDSYLDEYDPLDRL